MRARLFLTPIDDPIAEMHVGSKTRLLDLVPDDLSVEWFKEDGIIRIDGELIPPDKWKSVSLLPNNNSVVDFVFAVPSGKKTFAILATVAAIALTAGIAAYGIPFLGVAAGSFWANAIAAGIGIASSLAISALTAPPLSGSRSPDDRITSQAGVSGNTISLLEPLPVVAGKIGTSPPLLCPPYTEWDGDEITAYAIVGLQGRCLIENVKINGLDSATYAGATIETKEGYAGDTARTLFLNTVIEERDGITLTNFKTDNTALRNDELLDQATPDNSSPHQHEFRTAGSWDEVLFRFMFPSGIVYAPDAAAAVVPLRMEIRKVGDVTWRKLPTFHFQDVNKGGAPMRAEIRLKRTATPDGGRHFAWGGNEFPILSASNLTGDGKTWEYESDAYFGSGVTIDAYGAIGVALTSDSSASPIVVSASSASAGAAHQAHDSSSVSYWSPAAGLPAWLKVDFGSAKTIRSYSVRSDFTNVDQRPNSCPTVWTIEGSNDNTNWTVVSTVDDSEYDTFVIGHFQIDDPGSYRYYRINISAVKSGTQPRITMMTWRETDVWGSQFGNWNVGQPYGDTAYNQGLTTKIKCKYVSLDRKGATVFLDPTEWEAGDYEIRLKRGWAGRYDLFGDETTYFYDGNVNNTYFFDAQLGGGVYSIYAGPKNYRSDTTIEAFQTIEYTEPLDATGIALIAVAIPNVQISSIYAEFTSYATIFNGTSWDPVQIPTSNPAAIYRSILLGSTNFKPVPGPAIDEDNLEEWYDYCVTNSLAVNAIINGRSVGEFKQLVASAGYASPRDADLYGVVIDKYTSADPIQYLITPQNSKADRDVSEIRDIPDAIRAEYNNAAISYGVDHVIVYRDGKDAGNSTVFETISYPGLTSEAEVIARATFDLRQSYLRQTRYVREVGLSSIGIKRGTVVGLSDDTIDGNTMTGWIKSVEISGGNVISITLDNVAPWSLSDEFENVEDLSSITDVLDSSQAMGVAIRIPGSNVLIKQVSNVSDSNVCTFSTPFADDGSVVPNLLVAAGNMSTVYRRCKVLQVTPVGFEKRRLVLVDEANELHS